MESYREKFIAYLTPLALLIASVAALYKGITGDEANSVIVGLVLFLLSIFLIFFHTYTKITDKEAKNRLDFELTQRNIDQESLKSLEQSLYLKSAKAIAFLTKVYVQKKMLDDVENIFTPQALHIIDNGIQSLKYNPLYSSIENFAEKNARLKQDNFSLEQQEEIHAEFILEAEAWSQNVNRHSGLSANGIPIKIDAIEYEELYNWTKPVGKITDINNDELFYEITYSIKNYKLSRVMKERLVFDISDISNPKVKFFANDTQINNIFQSGLVPDQKRADI